MLKRVFWAGVWSYYERGNRGYLVAFHGSWANRQHVHQENEYWDGRGSLKAVWLMMPTRLTFLFGYWDHSFFLVYDGVFTDKAMHLTVSHGSAGDASVSANVVEESVVAVRELGVLSRP